METPDAFISFRHLHYKTKKCKKSINTLALNMHKMIQCKWKINVQFDDIQLFPKKDYIIYGAREDKLCI